MSRPNRLGMYREPKPFWLVTGLQSLVLVIAAYFTAFFLYLVVISAMDIPRGWIWQESLRSPMTFIAFVAVAVVLLIPYFQKEWDRGMRLFSIVSAIFLIALSAGSSTHILDPAVTVDLITRYVMDPLRHFMHL